MADSGNRVLGFGTEYVLSGKIMLSAFVLLFAVVVSLAGLHLYARWYALHLRRRLQRRVSLSQIVTYIDSRLPSDRGLDREVLNSLPVFLHEPDRPPPECAVCLSEFEEREIGRVLPKCGHSFHIECIDTWFRSHSTCPLCRSLVEQVVKAGGAEPGSRSGSANLLGETKVRIDVPARSVEPENESVQGSPASRILSEYTEHGETVDAWRGGPGEWAELV